MTKIEPGDYVSLGGDFFRPKKRDKRKRALILKIEDNEDKEHHVCIPNIIEILGRKLKYQKSNNNLAYPSEIYVLK